MKSSSLSSKDADVNSFSNIIKTEAKRYAQKGIGLTFASMIVVFFFFQVPKIVYQIYPFLANISRFPLIFIGSNLVHFISFSTGNLVLFALYKLEIPFIERCKVSSDPWPWKTDPKGFSELLIKSFKMIAFNQFFCLPIMIALPVYFERDPYVTSLEEFPGTLEIIVHLLFFMIMEDAAFYWSHRLLHHKAFYARFHKIHHEYHSPVGITVYYAHPIEFMIGNVLTSSTGPLLLGRCHIVTYWMWMVIRVMESTDGHSGYEFSWSPFRLLTFSLSSQYHNFHHSHNVGNYGSFFGFWDTFCKTNTNYLKFITKNEKKD